MIPSPNHGHQWHRRETGRAAAVLSFLAIVVTACDPSTTSATGARSGPDLEAVGSSPTDTGHADGNEELVPELETGDYFIDIRTGEAMPLPESITDLASRRGGYQASPDGRMLLFEGVDRTSAVGQIFLANVDGSHVRRLTDEPSGASEASWSPSGTEVIYVAGLERGYQSIAVVEIASGATTRIMPWGSIGLGPLTPPSARPRFGPDGASILFTGERRGSVALWSWPISAGAGAVVRDPAAWGSYAPGGDKIAFVVPLPAGNRDPRWVGREAWVANPDGSDARLLFGDGLLRLSAPVWSPDGARIVVSTPTTAYVLDVSTGVPTSITSGFADGWLDDDTVIVEVG